MILAVPSLAVATGGERQAVPVPPGATVEYHADDVIVTAQRTGIPVCWCEG